jgi:hypothetical protein
MTWFEELTGFEERSPEQVRENITVVGERLTSKPNEKVMVCGRLETPTLGELRRRTQGARRGNGAGGRASGKPGSGPASGGEGGSGDQGDNGGEGGKLSVREVVGDARALHRDESNRGALFQVASQLNLLEMASPSVTPEQGVGIYEQDLTQGPACAIAAGAGTIYRNYFAPVDGQAGQTKDNQIDCLADLGKRLGNLDGRLWEVRNGYCLPSRAGLSEISETLRASSDEERDELRKLVRVGIQWDTQVTDGGCEHLVSQVYCSALPVAYCNHPADSWEGFARLVLEAAYEATVCAGILNRGGEEGSDRLFLTLLGGGAFGNEPEWILDSVRRALDLHGRGSGLDLALVSFKRSNPEVRKLTERL